MSDEALLLLAFLIAIAGMGCFALSITAHWKQLLAARGQSALTRMFLRSIGASLLAASFVLCNVADPFMMAMLVWPMLLLVGAFVVAAGLTLHAQRR